MRVAASHFSGLVLLTPFNPPHPQFHPAPFSPHSDPPTPQVLETLMSHVLGNGISWSLLIIIGHFMPSPTHTLSLHPALARSLEKEQKGPCSQHCLFPSLSSPPLFFSLLPPSTSVHSALSSRVLGRVQSQYSLSGGVGGFL